ncbi:MAG: FAD-dependent oxidoreductase [Candidatus Eisenbacteria sp.]|nr:FAD-dependent oxidoreductase [Candidatus Eisenbacteria bacterium]
MSPYEENGNVLILGGGYAGLAAAYRLGRHGIPSTLIEAQPKVGGLAACSTIDGVAVEHFYHHIKPEDGHVISLIEELGLGYGLHWADTRMGFYIDGSFHPFSTPMDLLRFSPLSLMDRFRFAWGVFKAKRTEGKTLEGMNAEEWVVREWGRSVYERIMRPMLMNKFGIPPAWISAGFLQGRIKGLSSAKSSARGGEQLAYLRGSLQTLTDRLEEEIRNTCHIRVSTPIERIDTSPDGFHVHSGDEEFTAPFVVNTLPLTVFESIRKNFEFRTSIQYQAVACGVFSIEEELTPLYWINILDDDVTFRVFVNQSRMDEYSHPIVYCANYLRADDPLFRRPDDEILDLYIGSMKKMFGRVTLREGRLFRSRHATPVFDRDFAARTANLDDCVPGMVFAGNIKVYPYSRTVSSVIGTGFAAADRILEGSRP